MSKHRNFRVVGIDCQYFHTIEVAKTWQLIRGGRIECYVYGYGWVRWCESMREREAVES